MLISLGGPICLQNLKSPSVVAAVTKPNINDKSLTDQPFIYSRHVAVAIIKPNNIIDTSLSTFHLLLTCSCSCSCHKTIHQWYIYDTSTKDQHFINPWLVTRVAAGKGQQWKINVSLTSALYWTSVDVLLILCCQSVVADVKKNINDTSTTDQPSIYSRLVDVVKAVTKWNINDTSTKDKLCITITIKKDQPFINSRLVAQVVAG